MFIYFLAKSDELVIYYENKTINLFNSNCREIYINGIKTTEKILRLNQVNNTIYIKDMTVFVILNLNHKKNDKRKSISKIRNKNIYSNRKTNNSISSNIDSIESQNCDADKFDIELGNPQSSKNKELKSEEEEKENNKKRSRDVNDDNDNETFHESEKKIKTEEATNNSICSIC